MFESAEKNYKLSDHDQMIAEDIFYRFMARLSLTNNDIMVGREQDNNWHLYTWKHAKPELFKQTFELFKETITQRLKNMEDYVNKIESIE